MHPVLLKLSSLTSWQDRVRLVYEFHCLMLEEYGQAKDGRPTKDEKRGWSYRRTSEILKIPLGPLHIMCCLAQMLERDKSLDSPTVTFKEACRRLKENGK